MLLFFSHRNESKYTYCKIQSGHFYLNFWRWNRSTQKSRCRAKHGIRLPEICITIACMKNAVINNMPLIISIQYILHVQVCFKVGWVKLSLSMFLFCKIAKQNRNMTTVFLYKCNNNILKRFTMTVLWKLWTIL